MMYHKINMNERKEKWKCRNREEWNCETNENCKRMIKKILNKRRKIWYENVEMEVWKWDWKEN